MNQEEQLLEWKKEYGYIFVSEINEIEFVFRPLNYIEFESIRKNTLDIYDLDEKICELCILSPLVDWTDSIYAGYSSSLGLTIREESLLIEKEDGSNNVQNLIEEKKNEISESFILQLPMIIKHVFNEYSLDELNNMNMIELLDLYAKAIWSIKQFEQIEFSHLDE